MNKKIIAVIIALVLAILVWFLDSPSKFGFCFQYEYSKTKSCIAPYGMVADVLFPLVLVFGLMSLIFQFATRKTFSRWVKFTIGYVLVAGALMFVFSKTGVPLGWSGIGIMLEFQQLAVVFGSLYALVSLILLAVSEFFERRHKKTA